MNSSTAVAGSFRNFFGFIVMVACLAYCMIESYRAYPVSSPYLPVSPFFIFSPLAPLYSHMTILAHERSVGFMCLFSLGVRANREMMTVSVESSS